MVGAPSCIGIVSPTPTLTNAPTLVGALVKVDGVIKKEYIRFLEKKSEKKKDNDSKSSSELAGVI